MAREIKYRAFLINEMIEGSPAKMYQVEELVFDADGLLCIVKVDGLKLDIQNVEALLQYTGLHDKNGKEIYEGDVVQFPYGGQKKLIHLIVTWGLSGWWLKFPAGGWFGLNEKTDHFKDKFEVIGNIYENSDLLKES